MTTAASAPTQPPAGRFHQIQAGAGGLLTTVTAVYGLPAGAARLRRAQEINAHPHNRRFWRAPKNDFERTHFREGIIDFNPAFTCGSAQWRASAGESRCHARIWLPAAPLPSPAGPATPGLPPTDPVFPNVPPTQPRLLPRPAVEKSCGSVALRVQVQQHWARGVEKLEKALTRLRELERRGGAVRRGAWNAGPERKWFGLFTPRSLRVARTRLEGARRVLRDPALVIACDKARKSFAYASRLHAPRRITLAHYWFERPAQMTHATWLRERTQTLVHEATHLAGVHRRLREIYSEEEARRLARRNPAGALNNADNYGYYVMGFE